MFSSLRWSELGGLRRGDIDLATCTVRVTRQLIEVRGGGFAFESSKSRAAIRSGPIPEVLISIIRWHLACFAEQGDEGLIFTSPAGKPLRQHWSAPNLPDSGPSKIGVV